FNKLSQNGVVIFSSKEFKKSLHSRSYGTIFCVF
ncbi:MAG: hypothetical protein ACI94Y_001770, partial [Maribacter sp.]